MRQILVLSADDLLRLRQGGSLEFQVGDAVVTLMIEAAVRAITSNGGGPPAPAITPSRKQTLAPVPPPVIPGKHRAWTDAHKAAFVAELKAAVKAGQTRTSVLKRWHLSPAVMSRWPEAKRIKFPHSGRYGPSKKG
jgi:hypothetical protein